ncbi:restriction endonuclease subunit S [Lactococcus petauri]|uniref:restriction endonuclease subunit S n=1 Tax=Lactococcus petauri TaxID=1940789 RepID=UPI001BCE3CED|nr:restriction endonuclease subunit S [Lactococcus petauri]MBS4460726.1 restriction endonuclease subunit S [Lactococcus petauri]
MSKKSPQLRFEGFTDDWEERKLGELSNIVGGGTPSTSNPEYWDGDIDWYAPAEIGEQSYVSKSKKTITELGLKKSSARILPVGTVLFTSRAGIGNTAILAKEATTNQGFQSIVPDQNKLDSYFIFSRTNELKRYGEVTGAGSTFVEVSGKQMSIMIPELSEQQKIGSFFKQLDDTIALHQRKLDLLKEQKKGFLQKMFPKNGAKVPELRFAGFADDWEERKLGEHAKYRRGSFPQPYGNKEWYDGEGAMPFVQVVDVTNKLTLVENTKQKISKLAQSKSVFVPKGTVVVTLQGSIGRVAITQYDSFVDRTLLIFEDYEKETDERFWAYTIQKKFEIEKLKAPGGTIKTITKEALSSFDVHLPQFKEQAKIGSFFNQLDDTIALHQRKLDLLKEQKKGFLQKMFV